MLKHTVVRLRAVKDRWEGGGGARKVKHWRNFAPSVQQRGDRRLLERDNQRNEILWLELLLNRHIAGVRTEPLLGEFWFSLWLETASCSRIIPSLPAPLRSAATKDSHSTLNVFAGDFNPLQSKAIQRRAEIFPLLRARATTSACRGAGLYAQNKGNVYTKSETTGMLSWHGHATFHQREGDIR